MSRNISCVARILIIEDEPLIAGLLEDILEKAGHVCVGICTTIETALVMIEKGEIDAAFMDLVLKGKPAYEVCAALAVKEIPFAFASGVSPQAIEPLWRDRLHIDKPFSAAEVNGVLAKLLATPVEALQQIIDNRPPSAEQSLAEE